MIITGLLMKQLIKRRFKKKFIFKNNYMFFKKLFSMFIKNGLKTRVVLMFIKFINILKKKKIKVNIYLYQIYKKILPVLVNSFFFKKGSKIIVAKLNKNNLKKLNTISSIWVKKSVYLRKEKSLFLKIISEVESIRKGNASSLSLKKNYYTEFYKNKKYTKFFKKKNWI